MDNDEIHKMNDPHVIHGLFHANDINKLYNEIPFGNKSLSSSMNCTFQLHKETYDIKSSTVVHMPNENSSMFLRQTIRNSIFPGLLQKNGDYIEPSSELLQHLNTDFRLQPALLHTVDRQSPQCTSCDTLREETHDTIDMLPS